MSCREVQLQTALHVAVCQSVFPCQGAPRGRTGQQPLASMVHECQGLQLSSSEPPANSSLPCSMEPAFNSSQPRRCASWHTSAVCEHEQERSLGTLVWWADTRNPAQHRKCTAWAGARLLMPTFSPCRRWVGERILHTFATLLPIVAPQAGAQGQSAARVHPHCIPHHAPGCAGTWGPSGEGRGRRKGAVWVLCT